jgi:DNA (cytosine-5)-methyltransferase 1
MIKVLNLYAGIGGNRKLWTNVEVTAVEIDPKIAAIYQDFFPNDKVVIADAHQFLLDHFDEFDFIWSSPPCPTHSRMRFLKNNCEECVKKFPDMKLYEEILLLKHFAPKDCRWVVENVMSYYDPLIKPYVSGNHYFWANFFISPVKKVHRDIRSTGRKDKWGFDLINYDIPEKLRTKILNNLVYPDHGLHVFNMAFKDKQRRLNECEAD